MRPPAPTGQTSTEPRAVNRATNITRTGEQTCPESELQEARQVLAARGVRVGRSAVVRMFRFYCAQANFEASFVDWLTYSDRTGETATNNVLWGHAEAVA